MEVEGDVPDLVVVSAKAEGQEGSTTRKAKAETWTQDSDNLPSDDDSSQLW